MKLSKGGGCCGFLCVLLLLVDCASLQWEVNTAEQLVCPKARSVVRRDSMGLEQLETLSKYVLHLEQSTVVKLP